DVRGDKARGTQNPPRTLAPYQRGDGPAGQAGAEKKQSRAASAGRRGDPPQVRSGADPGVVSAPPEPPRPPLRLSPCRVSWPGTSFHGNRRKWFGFHRKACLRSAVPEGGPGTGGLS